MNTENKRKSTDYPVGSTVRGRDAFDVPFEGQVTAHYSDGLVVLDNAVITPIALLEDPRGDQSQEN
jgi:hypothetical protein